MNTIIIFLVLFSLCAFSLSLFLFLFCSQTPNNTRFTKLYSFLFCLSFVIYYSLPFSDLFIFIFIWLPKFINIISFFPHQINEYLKIEINFRPTKTKETKKKLRNKINHREKRTANYDRIIYKISMSNCDVENMHTPNKMLSFISTFSSTVSLQCNFFFQYGF